MSWIASWGAFWLAKLLAALGGWLLILSASYLIAMLLTAVVVLPLLLNRLSTTDYPELARMGSDSVAAATWNSIWAAVLFIIGWLVTLPLWLVPGLGLILPFSGWPGLTVAPLPMIRWRPMPRMTNGASCGEDSRCLCWRWV